jgi:hypothetical protein
MKKKKKNLPLAVWDWITYIFFRDKEARRGGGDVTAPTL